ncbi:MAG: adenylate/guanylate cyclase domain-containing protein [Leptospiraceae bacterium]|nr:adenylate/guanylate cyclase domain-containing protein [Leptospiraceae bacterium]
MKQFFIFFLIAGIILSCEQKVLKKQPQAKNGIISFKDWDFETDGTLSVSGEWYFYFQEYISPEKLLEKWKQGDNFLKEKMQKGEKKDIPAVWGNYKKPNSEELIENYGFATYLVKLENLPVNNDLAIKIKEQGTSYKLYGCHLKPQPKCKLLVFNGVPGETRETTVPQILNKLVRFHPIDSEYVFLVHLANFHHREGGLWEDVTLGSFRSLVKQEESKNAITYISLGIILIMALYHLGLVSQRKEDIGSLIFSFFCINITFRMLAIDRILHSFYPEPSTIVFDNLYKIEYLTIYFGLPLFYMFIQSIFWERFSKKFGYILFGISSIFAISVIFFPTYIFSQYIAYYYIVMLSSGIYILYGLALSIKDKLPGSGISAFGFFAFMLTIINDILHSRSIIHTLYLAHYGFLFFIFSQSMILSFRFSLAYKESELLRISMKRFVPNQFINALEKKSIIDLKIGDATHKQMTVLFSDIREFTTLSESMTPRDNFRFLNSYLKRMEPAITSHNGFVDKFIGDAIMALFEHEPENAVLAAIEMKKRLKEYNEDRKSLNYPPVKIGIGINTGDLMLGTIGSSNRLDTTVIGDTVNIASRLESLTKEFQSTILISEIVYNSLTNLENYFIREVGSVIVKGKNHPTKIYEVYNNDDEATFEKKQKSYPTLLEGKRYMQEKRFVDAITSFEKCLEIYPEDKVSKAYLDKCKKRNMAVT